MMAARAISLSGTSFRDRTAQDMRRALPEETPVAIVYNGSTQAVMMATPDDLMDFGRGFSLSEGIVDTLAQIEGIEVVAHSEGLEIQMWLAEDKAEALAARRRTMTGPVGCGLCGIDSLAEAVRPLPTITAPLTLTPEDVDAAVAALTSNQPLHDQTRAVHGAAFYVPGQGIALAREDVGRHNALDKLIGAMATAGIDPTSGALVLTSRVSVDMVQKCAMAGVPVLIAVSAPTAHAVRTADAAGITIAALARGAGFDLFTHPERIDGGHNVA